LLSEENKKGKKKGEKEKILNPRVRENKKRKKIPDQGSEENKRNMQKGLWIRQHLNNTKLSPSKQKRKGTTT